MIKGEKLEKPLEDLEGWIFPSEEEAAHGGAILRKPLKGTTYNPLFLLLEHLFDRQPDYTPQSSSYALVICIAPS